MSYQLVTRGQFAQFLAATGYDYPPELLLRQNWTHPDTPMVWVSQVDALAYCEWAKGSLPPSKYYDTPANLIWSGLWEWCSESGVLRGGSFGDLSDLARCAYRSYYGPADRNYVIGFRCSNLPT